MMVNLQIRGWKMEDKRILITVSSISVYIICMVLNFTVFFSCSTPVTMKNGIVTLIYITVLVMAPILGIIIKNRKVVKYSSIFWGATLFSALILLSINIPVIKVLTENWMMPFIVLFIIPLGGLEFFVNSNILNAIIITIIALVMFIITVMSLKHTKSAK